MFMFRCCIDYINLCSCKLVKSSPSQQHLAQQQQHCVYHMLASYWSEYIQAIFNVLRNVCNELTDTEAVI